MAPEDGLGAATPHQKQAMDTSSLFIYRLDLRLILATNATPTRICGITPCIRCTPLVECSAVSDVIFPRLTDQPMVRDVAVAIRGRNSRKGQLAALSLCLTA